MLNQVVIMGRLAADPELRMTGNNIAVCSFSIACDRDYKAKDAERETDWFDCVAWRGTAEFICRNFFKGQSIAISGRLQTRTYVDKQGNKRKVTEVVADNAYFCGKKEPGSYAAPDFSDSTVGSFEELSDEEDLPF